MTLKAPIESLEVLRLLARAPALEPDDAAPLRPADRLGDFRIDERIGRGGMGTVYRAWDIKLQRPVAIKVLRRSVKADAAQARLLREAQALAAAAHANVAAVYQVVSEPQHTYLVMELVPGESLRARYEREPLPFVEAVALYRQLCAAVAHLHRAGVTHRDLTPQNVMVRADGTLKLIDFGLASDVDGSFAGASLRGAGTPKYNAPEQVNGATVDARADVYALGVMLGELLEHSLVTARHRRAAAALRALARAATVEQPVDRPDDAVAFEVMLARALAPRRRYWALALALLALAGLAWGLWRRPAPEPELPLQRERRVTFFPRERGVVSVALSPDGRHLASLTQDGLFIAALDTDQAPTLLAAQSAEIISSAEWLSNEELLLVTRVGPLRSDLRGVRMRLDGQRSELSLPFGSQCRIARRTGRLACFTTRGLKVGGLDGRPWASVMSLRPDDQVIDVAWAPDGERLAALYLPSQTIELGEVIDTFDFVGSTQRRVMQSHGLGSATAPGAIVWPTTERLLFVSAESDPTVLRTHLWALPIDAASTLPAGPARKLHTWVGAAPTGFSSSDDGALAYVRMTSQDDVYVAALNDGGRRLEQLKRLTWSERNERPSGWLGADVLFTSDASGHLAAMRQGPTGAAQPLSATTGELQTWPVATPDGSAVLWWSGGMTGTQMRLVRHSLVDERETTLLSIPHETAYVGRRPPPIAARVVCAARANRCVYARNSGHGYSFSWLDPLTGDQSASFLEMPLPDPAGFALDADAERLALAQDTAPIEVRNLATGAMVRLPSPEECAVSHVAFSADGSSLFGVAYCEVANVARVYRFEAGQPPQVLYEQWSAWFGHPQVSPEGDRLAFQNRVFEGDGWLISGTWRAQ